MSDIYFEVLSALHKRIRVTRQYWDLITSVKHTTMIGRETLVKTALKNPMEIRKSNKDKTVFIYYTRFGKYFVAVVCKHLNGDGHIITTYITDRIKIGEVVWKKQK